MLNTDVITFSANLVSLLRCFQQINTLSRCSSAVRSYNCSKPNASLTKTHRRRTRAFRSEYKDIVKLVLRCCCFLASFCLPSLSSRQKEALHRETSLIQLVFFCLTTNIIPTLSTRGGRGPENSQCSSTVQNPPRSLHIKMTASTATLTYFWSMERSEHGWRLISVSGNSLRLKETFLILAGIGFAWQENSAMSPWQ